MQGARKRVADHKGDFVSYIMGPFEWRASSLNYFHSASSGQSGRKTRLHLVSARMSTIELKESDPTDLD